jgi:hypothetical protein
MEVRGPTPLLCLKASLDIGEITVFVSFDLACNQTSIPHEASLVSYSSIDLKMDEIYPAETLVGFH